MKRYQILGAGVSALCGCLLLMLLVGLYGCGEEDISGNLPAAVVVLHVDKSPTPIADGSRAPTVTPSVSMAKTDVTLYSQGYQLHLSEIGRAPTLLKVKLTITAGIEGGVNVNPMNARLVGSDGATYQPIPTADSLPYVEVLPLGQSVTGWLYFPIPASAKISSFDYYLVDGSSIHISTPGY